MIRFHWAGLEKMITLATIGAEPRSSSYPLFTDKDEWPPITWAPWVAYTGTKGTLNYECMASVSVSPSFWYICKWWEILDLRVARSLAANSSLMLSLNPFQKAAAKAFIVPGARLRKSISYSTAAFMRWIEALIFWGIYNLTTYVNEGKSFAVKQSYDANLDFYVGNFYRETSNWIRHWLRIPDRPWDHWHNQCMNLGFWGLCHSKRWSQSWKQRRWSSTPMITLEGIQSRCKSWRDWDTWTCWGSWILSCLRSASRMFSKEPAAEVVWVGSIVITNLLLTVVYRSLQTVNTNL